MVAKKCCIGGWLGGCIFSIARRTLPLPPCPVSGVGKEGRGSLTSRTNGLRGNPFPLLLQRWTCETLAYSGFFRPFPGPQPSFQTVEQLFHCVGVHIGKIDEVRQQPGQPA